MINLYEDKNTRAYFGIDRYEFDVERSDLIREADKRDRKFWEEFESDIERK